MTVLSTFARIQITGITGGVWKRDVDVNALSAVPAGTTHAIFQLEITSTASTAGVQNADDTEDFISASFVRADQTKFIPINASKTFDFYLSNSTSGKWYLVGYTSHLVGISPVDKSSSVTGGSTYTIDCSADLPSGAANGYALISLSRLAKVGAVGATANQYKSFPNNPSRAHLIVPLDASRRFEVSGSAAMSAGELIVLGWMAALCYQKASDFTTFRYTPGTLSAWVELPHTSSTYLDQWYISNATSTSGSASALIAEMRPGGNTAYTTTDADSSNGTRFIAPNGSGKVEVYCTIAGEYFTWYGGFVADTTAAAISGVDTFVAGATATVTFDKSVASVTRIRATSAAGFDTPYVDITSFSGSGATRTFTVPDFLEGADGLRLGPVILTPTTNTGTGVDFTGKTYSKTGFSGVNIEDVLPGNVCDGDTPGLATGNQVAYDSTTGASVDVHGIYNDPPPIFVGTQTMWHYAADFKWYSFTITTSEPAASGAFTRAITDSDLSTVALSTIALTTRS